MSDLDEATRAILGYGATDTSGPLQTGPMFDETSVSERATTPPLLQPTMDAGAPSGPLAPAAPPPSAPPAQAPTDGSPTWLKWALGAALVAGVGFGVYYYTREPA